PDAEAKWQSRLLPARGLGLYASRPVIVVRSADKPRQGRARWPAIPWPRYGNHQRLRPSPRSRKAAYPAFHWQQFEVDPRASWHGRGLDQWVAGYPAHQAALQLQRRRPQSGATPPRWLPKVFVALPAPGWSGTIARQAWWPL